MPATALSGLSFEEISLSPDGACLVGIGALRAGRPEIALRLASGLREKMLPSPENPWDGPARGFWALAFRSGIGAKILSEALPTASREALGAAGRDLLILAASARDGDSLGQLLAFKAARRSKSVLFSAFWHGGWKMAERIKPPTAQESEELLREFARRPSVNPEADVESFLWAASFLPAQTRLDGTPVAYFDPAWCASVAQRRGPEFALAIAEHLPRFGMESLEPPRSLMIVGSFLAAGAFEAAERCLGSWGLSWSDPLSPPGQPVVFQVSAPQRSASQGLIPAQASGFPLAGCALFSPDPAHAYAAFRKGSPLPSRQDLLAVKVEDRLSRSMGLVSSLNSSLQVALSSLEAAELRASIPEAPSRSRPSRGM